MRPSIIVSKVGDRYGINCQGRFGGGYHIPVTKTLEQAAQILARDGRTYDCGKEPILIVAPAEVRELAGF